MNSQRKSTDRDLEELKVPYRLFSYAVAYTLIVGGFCLGLFLVYLALPVFGIDSSKPPRSKIEGTAVVISGIGLGAFLAYVFGKAVEFVLAITFALFGDIPWRLIRATAHDFDFPKRWLKTGDHN